ncbi:sterol desaturase family protein [Paraglaciecola sp. 25GB23A]|uniref:sterol desaturase family protein n=1 Tax=Paraglaciecola sp. 25GB23A TaxID=3156068 RepID=UPI0032AED569
MSLFSMKHSKAAYRADFVLYGAAVLVLLAFLLQTERYGQWLEFSVLLGLGLVSWTLIEYALHRFVMHGLQPFSRWHAEHHQRPTALICTPTIISMLLIATLVFLPVLLLSDNLWQACALTLGVVVGYLFYSVMHHATHHWRAESAWLKQRKRWHAQHHCNIVQPACFGVTSGFWDHVFRSSAQHRK